MAFVRFSSFLPRRMQDALTGTLDRTGLNVVIRTHYPPRLLRGDFKVRYNRVWGRLERGDWELPALSKLAAHVRQGDIVLDIGAWIGVYTMLLSHLVGRRGTVVAFEPDPIAMTSLKYNVGLNKIRNLFLSRVCLSDYTGPAVLKATKFGGSGSSITRYADNPRIASLIVSCSTIDAFCSSNNLRPSGLKIDAEGAETLILRGAKNTIRACHPWILLEFHGLLTPRMDERRKLWQEILSWAKRYEMVDGSIDGIAHVFIET
jgi:FkbM family methyltransferase